MEIKLTHLENFAFDAIGVNNTEFTIDGNNQMGPSPTSMLLHAVGACSGIDLVDILKKMKEEIKGLNISVKGEMEKVEEHKKWKHISIHFTLKGDLTESKVQRAIKLSMEKYCSVSKMLETFAKIDTSYEILPAE